MVMPINRDIQPIAVQSLRLVQELRLNSRRVIISFGTRIIIAHTQDATSKINDSTTMILFV